MPSPSSWSLPWLLAILPFLPWAHGQAPLEHELLILTNQAREAHGLAPLQADPGLARAAAAHAREMAERSVLTHTSVHEDHRTPAQRVARAGVASIEVAENLALIEGSDVAARSLQGWLDSPGHRRNLLNGRYTHVGHAVVGVRDYHWVVQVFAARPLTRLSATATPTPATDDRTAGVRIELRYLAPESASLALFVNRVHRPAASVAPGVLRLDLPRPAETLRVAVGIDNGDGTARLIERFVLRPGPPPRLLPGDPAEAANGTLPGTDETQAGT